MLISLVTSAVVFAFLLLFGDQLRKLIDPTYLETLVSFFGTIFSYALDWGFDFALVRPSCANQDRVTDVAAGETEALLHEVDRMYFFDVKRNR